MILRFNTLRFAAGQTFCVPASRVTHLLGEVVDGRAITRVYWFDGVRVQYEDVFAEVDEVADMLARAGRS